MKQNVRLYMLQCVVNMYCNPNLLRRCWSKSQLSIISYCFNSVLCRIYAQKPQVINKIIHVVRAILKQIPLARLLEK